MYVFRVFLRSSGRHLNSILGTSWRSSELSRAACLACGCHRVSERKISLHHPAFSARKVKKKEFKKLEVVKIWRRMTVTDLAVAVKRDVDHVFEILLMTTDVYDREDSSIEEMELIVDVVKKSGYRWMIAPPPDSPRLEAVNKDAHKRPPPEVGCLVKRPPVVTVMGHVDHGKTTLLDSLRHTHVVDQEFGGITQHIGAFSVSLPTGDKVTFLDTPGHTAFHAMRARGTSVTDIIILVVAADDGVKKTTIESIQLAKDAQVPVIVAINKIDKPEANIDRCKKGLLEHGIQLEDLGGEVQSVEISALKGTNLDALVEAIVTQAEIMELKGDPRGFVEGTVVESSTDPGRGKLCTAIIQRGTLHKGSVLVAGTAWGRVRGMFSDAGRSLTKAGLSAPVEIIGWKELPQAGDEILEVEREKRAHEVVNWRKHQRLREKQEKDSVAIEAKMEEHLKEYRIKLEKKRALGIYRLRPEGPKAKEYIEDTTPRVSVVIKGDVDGSVEALLDVLDSYHSDECRLDVVHYGVGQINETDVERAALFQGILYAFNVNVPTSLRQLAKEKDVPVREFNIIYRLVDDVKEEISKKLPLDDQHATIGEALVLDEFLVTEKRRKHPVAGCRCTKGELKKGALFKVIRDEEVLYDGHLASMRHLKEEVSTVKKEVECGIRLDNPDIRFKKGDQIQCYQINKVKKHTDWDPGF